VVFLVQARRFRCPNPACSRKTFREDLSALAACYQRRTQEKRTAQEQRFVQSLLEHSELIAHAYEYLRRFRQILTALDETALQPWACEAEASQISELMRFVRRLHLDWEAVENALLFACSHVTLISTPPCMGCSRPPNDHHRGGYCVRVASSA
jgi:transposase